MNICLCGTEAGYPHKYDCPRPLFRCSETEEQKWDAEREELRHRLTQASDSPRWSPDPDRWGEMQ